MRAKEQNPSEAAINANCGKVSNIEYIVAIGRFFLIIIVGLYLITQYELFSVYSSTHLERGEILAYLVFGYMLMDSVLFAAYIACKGGK